MAQKRFHRHFETPGLPLYWIIIAYIILGWFFPVIGLLALICMIGPVVTSIFKGRFGLSHKDNDPQTLSNEQRREASARLCRFASQRIAS